MLSVYFSKQILLILVHEEYYINYSMSGIKAICLFCVDHPKGEMGLLSSYHAKLT